MSKLFHARSLAGQESAIMRPIMQHTTGDRDGFFNFIA